MIRKMPGSGIMCTASWLCGVWGWPIGRMQTGMRIRQRPMNWSRYSIKIQRALELGGGGRKCSPQELRQICFASHSFFTLLKLHSIKLSCIVRSFFFFFCSGNMKLADSGGEDTVCSVTVENPILRSLLKFVILFPSKCIL